MQRNMSNEKVKMPEQDPLVRNANFLEVIQGKIDSATSFIKDLVPDALLPGKSEDNQVEEEGESQAKSEEADYGTF